MDQAAKDLRNAHKRRQRNRNRQKFAIQVQNKVDSVKEVGIFNEFQTFEFSSDHNNEFLWDEVPKSIDPQLYNLKGKRGIRKRQQCESFAKTLQPLIEALYRSKLRKLKIVDFGSGTGNASLPLAFWFREKAEFILVDRYEVPINIAKKRVSEANLTNVTCITQFINDFAKSNQKFDIGFSSHACGSASDDAIRCCVTIGASFVIIPCCVGKLKYETSELPRSLFMRKYFTHEEFLELSRAGDHSEADFDEVLTDWKRNCKILLEIDRLAYSKESRSDYHLFLGKLYPLECSTKNDILLGYREINKLSY